MAWILPWRQCVDWLRRLEPDSDEHPPNDLTKQAEVRFTIRCPECGDFHQIGPHDPPSPVFDPRAQRFQCSCGFVAQVFVVIDRDPVPRKTKQCGAAH